MTDTPKVVLVPVEATPEMVKAARGWREWDTCDDAMGRAYQAALAASPFADVDVMAMIGALEKASRRFHEYEAGHAEKGTVDGDMKARRNAEMAELIDTALSTVPDALRESGG